MAKYDVVKDYDWTSSPRGSGMRKKAPRVWVKSYKLVSNQIMSAIQGFMAITDSADAKTFYDKMYSDSTTAEDDFNFPFFGDNVRQMTNTFGDTFQAGIGGSGGVGADLFSGIKGFVGGVANALNITDKDSASKAKDAALAGDFKGAISALGKGGSPGTYVETPMFYQFEKSDGPLQVSFVLANTINADSIEKNHNLIQRLQYINRPLRKSSIAVDPPRIYQVKVPGHRFIRWAYCSDLSINFLGTRREINGVIVPEAYQIDMSYTSLTLEHAGFLKEAK